MKQHIQVKQLYSLMTWVPKTVLINLFPLPHIALNQYIMCETLVGLKHYFIRLYLTADMQKVLILPQPKPKVHNPQHLKLLKD